MSTFVVLMVGMPISAGITAFVPYVNKNDVTPLLDLIMVQCAHKTCGSSSIQSLLLSSSRAFIPSPKLLFALSTKPLACGCLTDAQLFTPIFEWVVLELLFVIRYYFPRFFRERSVYVNSPFIEWPRGHDGIQFLLWVSWHGAVNLAILTFP
ncbi:hypothetical protein Tco_0221013, partial [Tanacetum coccineum]